MRASLLPAVAGEYLARAGDCVACHSVPGGKAFAGGLKMGSPLGTIYSTNITPDPETGIGNYSLDGFRSRRTAGHRQGRPPALSGDAVSVLRQADRRRRSGAVRFLHEAGAAGSPGEFEERDSAAPEFPLAACDLESRVHHQRQLCHRERPRRRLESRRLSGAGPRPLRRLPHPARLRLAGKGARRQQPGLSLRRFAGRLVRARPAR